MPDPMSARRSIWIPHMKNYFGVDKSTIIIGHSSGAEAAMRFAEQYEVLGLVLVSACHTDLGVSSETISGYYDGEWLWEKIKQNSKFIVQFGSSDDPFIPIEEMEHVAKNLNSEFIKYEDRGHFQEVEFQELIQKMSELLQKYNK